MDGGDRPAGMRPVRNPVFARDKAFTPAQHGWFRQVHAPEGRHDVDPARVRQALSACPEIDCLRHALPPGILAAAELRAAEIGTGADRVLIAAGHVEEGAYLGALAQSLGLKFESLEDVPRSACRLPDEDLPRAAAAGILPLRLEGEDVFVVAPQYLAARRLAGVFRHSAEISRRIRITSSAHLRAFADYYAADAVASKAKDELRRTRPELSASAQALSRVKVISAVAASFALLGLVGANAAITAAGIAFSLLFLGWAGLRLFGLLSSPAAPKTSAAIPDAALPLYTVIVALYREKAAVRKLIAALNGLAYPPEKLDIKLVVEPDDHETATELAKINLGCSFEVIVAPDDGPRTKPKALNAALPFARGSFTAVFDAEDLP
jgi:hypothetical protein